MVHEVLLVLHKRSTPIRWKTAQSGNTDSGYLRGGVEKNKKRHQHYTVGHQHAGRAPKWALYHVSSTTGALLFEHASKTSNFEAWRRLTREMCVNRPYYLTLKYVCDDETQYHDLNGNSSISFICPLHRLHAGRHCKHPVMNWKKDMNFPVKSQRRGCLLM